MLGQLIGMAGKRICAQAMDQQEDYKTANTHNNNICELMVSSET